MKILILATLISTQIFALSLDKKAPDFTLVGDDGKEHSLSDYRGQAVVLEWLNHGCPFVRKHYDTDNMQRTQKDAIDKNFIWISIISSARGNQGYASTEEAREQKKENRSLANHILLDKKGEIGRKYNAKVTPQIVILDKDHFVKYTGAIDSIPSTDTLDIKKATNYVKDVVADIFRGKEFTGKSNKAYGCSVKY